MTTNPTIKSLLFNARLLYLVKYQEVLKHLNNPDADLHKLNESFQTLFAHWGNPKFWSENIPWIAGKTSSLILQVDKVSPSQCDTFKTAATALLQHLEGDLLKAALQRITSTDISMWNLRMLNALRKISQQIEAKESDFNGQGKDLDADSEFQGLKKHQEDLLATYRNLLTNNAVEADETKVKNIKKRGTRIEAETVLSEFFHKHKKLSAYLNKQVTVVGLIPHFAETPSDENQKSINALSLALIKMDEQIGTLAEAGKDFTQEADFGTLSTDQLSLQNGFRKALYCNTITTTASDTDAIKQIGTSLTNVNDLSGIKTKYVALNDLMRNQIATIA